MADIKSNDKVSFAGNAQRLAASANQLHKDALEFSTYFFNNGYNSGGAFPLADSDFYVLTNENEADTPNNRTYRVPVTKENISSMVNFAQAFDALMTNLAPVQADWKSSIDDTRGA